MGARGCLIVALICVYFPNTGDTEHLFMRSLLICVSVLEICLFRSLSVSVELSSYFLKTLSSPDCEANCNVVIVLWKEKRGLRLRTLSKCTQLAGGGGGT